MRSWPNFEVVSRHSPGWTEGNQENFSQNSRSPGRNHYSPNIIRVHQMKKTEEGSVCSMHGCMG
jgi:hypothetical protein